MSAGTTKTCATCSLCRPKERVWKENHYGPGCGAQLDGIHAAGWTIKEDDGGNIIYIGELMAVTDCYYWQPIIEKYEQLSLF